MFYPKLCQRRTIRSFTAMCAAEKEQAEIAFAVNPDSRNITGLPNLKWIHSCLGGGGTPYYRTESQGHTDCAPY